MVLAPIPTQLNQVLNESHTNAVYHIYMDELYELPDISQNSALLRYLRGQANSPSGPDDYTLGPWQLHTHPDLMARLETLAPGWPLTAAYGIPLLASEGIAAVAAFGTDLLAIRIDQLPSNIEVEDNQEPAWRPCIRDGWHLLSPIQDKIPRGEVGSTLRELAAASLAHAAGLATK